MLLILYSLRSTGLPELTKYQMTLKVPESRAVQAATSTTILNLIHCHVVIIWTLYFPTTQGFSHKLYRKWSKMQLQSPTAPRQIDSKGIQHSSRVSFQQMSPIRKNLNETYITKPPTSELYHYLITRISSYKVTAISNNQLSNRFLKGTFHLCFYTSPFGLSHILENSIILY